MQVAIACVIGHEMGHHTKHHNALSPAKEAKIRERIPQEMVEDILAILHCFSSRLYGLRKYKTQMRQDKDLPQPRTK